MTSTTVRPFVERLGGVLVAPRDHFGAVLREPVGRGALDLLTVLALRVVAGELPLWARALGDARRALHDHSVFAVGSELLSTALHVSSGALNDVLAVLIGAMALALFSPRGTPNRGLDLAAYAWIPCVAVQLLATLVCALAAVAPSDNVQLAVGVVGVGASVVAWALALAVVRASATRSAKD